MLVGPQPAPLSAGEWRSEDDLPRPFFLGVVSRCGARRVAAKSKNEWGRYEWEPLGTTGVEVK